MRLFYSVLILVCFFVYNLALRVEFDSPQIQMVGARTTALGLSNPLVSDDFTNHLLNPSSLAFTNGVVSGLTYKTVLQEFEYYLFSTVFPVYFLNSYLSPYGIDDLSFSLTYGQLSSPKNFETFFSEFSNQIYEQESFYSSFSLLSSSLSFMTFDKLGFNQSSYGFNFKILRYHVDRHLSSYAFSTDFGMTLVKRNFYRYIDEFNFAFTINDLFGTQFDLKHSAKGLLPLRFGVASKMVFNDLSFYAFNHFENKVGLASSYAFSDTFSLNGATNFSEYSLGFSSIFTNVSLLDGQMYDLVFDYALDKRPKPYAADYDHVVTLSFRGVGYSKPPVILEPKDRFSIVKRFINLKGMAEKNATVYLYNDNELIVTVEADRYGFWSIKNLRLQEGENELKARILKRDMSLSSESNRLVVFADTTPPQFNLNVHPDKEGLKVTLISNEQLSKVSMQIDGKPVPLNSKKSKIDFLKRSPIVPEKWEATVPFPKFLRPGPLSKTMSKLTLDVIDLAGNSSRSYQEDFFTSLIFPEDKFVHSRNQIRVIGKVSAFVDRFFVNDQPVYQDEEGRYAITLPLNLGKNMLVFKSQFAKEKILFYTCRILRLQSFSDVNEDVEGQREINLMGTLGLFKPNNKEANMFFPNRFIDRAMMARFLVNQNQEIKLEDVDNDVYLDVPYDHPDAAYIQAAVKNGLMGAFADGNFNPDQGLTRAEIGDFLKKARLMNVDRLDGDQNALMQKWELAYALAYLPQYQVLIDELLNWETGYNVNF